jgi:hypothetical protein
MYPNGICCSRVSTIGIGVLAVANQGRAALRRVPLPERCPAYVSSVLVAAGQEIEKLPLRELSRPMTGHQPIAVAAESNRHR